MGKADKQRNPYSEVSVTGELWSVWVMGPYQSQLNFARAETEVEKERTARGDI